jgi:2-hydroxy-3-keto-5-methylthiopentenyl-1-phosphate phosphatase
MIIATDFDGTIVTHEYPKIGKEIPFAIETLKMLIKENHRIILWTVREGELLDEALEWCRERGVEFYAVNRDYPEEDVEHLAKGFSRKIKADVFIDDRNIGGIPDWGAIYRMVRSGHPHHQLHEESHGFGEAKMPKRQTFLQHLLGKKQQF